MATKAQLEEALKRADAAGATEDARALAMALKNRQYETPQLDPGPTDIDVNAVTPAPYGFGREMLSGLTFGYGDELEAALTDTPIEEIRAGQQKYRAENPWTAAGASMLGAAPTMIIPGTGLGNLARGIGAGGKLARAASAVGAGAASGALTGSGEAIEGDRVSGAKQGALIGGAMAPVGAAAGRGLGMIGSRVTGRGNVRLTPEQQADAVILGALGAEKITPEQVLRDMATGQTIADVGRPRGPVRELAGAATRLSPETRGLAAELVETRQASRPGELLRTVGGELMPDGRLTRGQIEGVTSAQRAAARPHYEQAYAEAGRISSPKIDALMRRDDAQKAYNRARSIANARGIDLPKWGSWTQMSLKTADTVKQGLDDMVYGAKRPTSSIGKNRLAALEQLRAEFVGAIDEVAPESYRVARSISAGGFRDQEAADLGAEMLKRSFTAEDVSRQLDALGSESERLAMRAGFMAEFEKQLNQMGESREAFRKLVNDPDTRAKIAALSTVEGPSAVTPLARRQRAEADFGSELLGGSATASRRSAEESLQGSIIPDVPTNTRDLLLQAIQGIRDKYRVGDQRAQSVGASLLTPDIEQNRNLLYRLDALENMMRQQAGQRGALGSSGATVGGAQTARED